MVFDPIERRITLYAHWASIARSHAVEALLLRLLGISCFDAGLIVLHAAGIATREGAYLFVGGSGSGKTSLCVPLCHQFDYQWVANDYLCLEHSQDLGVLVCERDDFIDFRKATFAEIRAPLPPGVAQEIRARFPAETTPWTKSSPPFRARELGLSEASLPCPVKGLFFHRVSEGGFEFTSRISKQQALSHLLAEIPWSLRGAGPAIANDAGEPVLPRLAHQPQEAPPSIRRTIHTLVNQCPAWAVHGPLVSAMEFVSSTVSSADSGSRLQGQTKEDDLPS